ncbi:MAG: hypothetical protein K6E93_09845 [Bacteroidales bacterium]|nr:hypothetical protein [Bacteroidales bacterium]
MKYGIFLLFIAMAIACSHQQQGHACQEHDYYDIKTVYVSYEMLKKQFVQITDTNQIMQLNTILNTGCDKLVDCPDNEYYYHRLFKKNPCFVVRLDDYFIREFAVWDDNSYIELSYEGGDGPYYSRSYSTTVNDSLITYIINTEYLMDEDADTMLDKYTIDTIRSAVSLNGKKLPAPNELL